MNQPAREFSVQALSPLDGRYIGRTAALRNYFSEFGLIRLRLHVEIEWLICLASHPQVKQLPAFSESTCAQLRQIVMNFSLGDALAVKDIEQKTNHDVKALEYFLKNQVQNIAELRASIEFIHFGLTSYDINDNCFALMLKHAKDEIFVPAVKSLIEKLSALAVQTAEIPMLARTHGQPASPTTVGKEFRVFAYRLEKQLESFRAVAMRGKLAGASGNFNALCSAYPQIDWLAVSRQFVETLGLTYSPIATQTESHDYIAEYCHALTRINTILMDLSRDLWSYISIGYFKQKVVADEVGSSAMPHKVNPIDFENAEGNLGLANAGFGHLADKLPISRWQRDLSDSTVLRNLGVPLGHSLIAYGAVEAGLSKLEVNSQRLNADLEEAWEVLSEGIQTVLRKHGSEMPYEELRKLTRGLAVSGSDMRQFIDQTELPADEKTALRAMTPHSYLGIASSLAKMKN